MARINGPIRTQIDKAKRFTNTYIFNIVTILLQLTIIGLILWKLK